MRCGTSDSGRRGEALRRRLAGAVAATAVAALTLAGCAVGPDFQQPKAPDTHGYLHPERQSTQGGQATQAAAQDVQHIAVGAQIAGKWWQLFRSPALEGVVREAIAGSPTLAAANATLAQAREEIIVTRAGLLPHLSASAGAQHSGEPASAIPGAASSNLYTVGLAASYSPDVFGGTRRAVEQQQALAEVQRDQLAAAYLTLTGDVVNEVLTIASTRLQISTTEELIASDQKNLALTQREFAVGVATRADVLTADSQLASDLTQLPTLHKQLDQAYDALAVLAGRTPAEWRTYPFDIRAFTLPRQVPLSLPSELVRQRPDILAAEAQLHAQSAAVGVAVAQEYPDITLSASLTRDALTAASLFHQFNTLWSAGGTLAQPIFEGGALRAQVRASRDAYNAQAAAYRSVVVTALGQVADDLWALQYDAELLTVDRHSVDVSLAALRLQQTSYQVGTTNVLNLIDAERTYAQARLAYATAEVQQYEDTASLLVAIGGGWWKDGIE